MFSIKMTMTYLKLNLGICFNNMDYKNIFVIYIFLKMPIFVLKNVQPVNKNELKRLHVMVN